MIGAEYLRDLRRQGLKPQIVFVYDLGKIENEGLFAPEVMIETGGHAEVHIEPDDAIASLDFRFLTGCAVSLLVNNTERARLIYKYIRAIRPKSITLSDGADLFHHEEF